MDERGNDSALHNRMLTKKREMINNNGVSDGLEKSQPLDDLICGMSETKVRKSMEKVKSGFVKHMNDQFDGFVSEVIKDLQVIDKVGNAKAFHHDDTEKLYADKRKSRNGALPEKEFIPRNSVLTDLYEIKHFRTIYNIFVMILIVISLHTIMHDLAYTGTTNLGWKLIMQGFAKFSIVIEIWLIIIASTFAAYGCFNYWAQRRMRFAPKSFRLKMWDYGWLVLFIVYQITVIVLPVQQIIWAKLPPVSRVVVLTEEIRIVMKNHAFVRSVTPRVTSQKCHSEDDSFTFPGFSKFLYFMFAPTLVYRDSYPRTKEIRWRFVLRNLFEVVLVTFNMAFIFERYLIPPFEEFGKHPFDIRSIALTVYGTAFPGILVFLSGFYCLLHAWMNAAAEVMKFGDRLFYKDWWNSTTYTMFYRRWNVVVHDWLYTYIYKDITEIVLPGHRFIPSLAVFFISAIFHEYIIGIAFEIFFPMMILQFGVVGFLLVFIIRTGHAWGNVFLWFSLCTGSGFMISLYTMEYFARLNCPRYGDSLMHIFLPRTLNCT